MPVVRVWCGEGSFIRVCAGGGISCCGVEVVHLLCGEWVCGGRGVGGAA